MKYNPEYEYWLDSILNDYDDEDRQKLDKWLEEEHEREQALSCNGAWVCYGTRWQSLLAIHKQFFEGVSVSYTTFYRRVLAAKTTDVSDIVTRYVENEKLWEMD